MVRSLILEPLKCVNKMFKIDSIYKYLIPFKLRLLHLK